MPLKGSHWDHRASSQIFGRTRGSTKPPKLRFWPGQFMREKSTGQLYCIMWAYRTVEDPHTWLFQLEERQDLDDPSTMISTHVEREVGGFKENNERIKWQPVHRNDMMMMGAQDYYHGDRTTITNKSMLNDFEMATTAGERII